MTQSSGSLDDIAMEGARTLINAMSTDAWALVKQQFLANLLRDDHLNARLDKGREAVMAAHSGHDFVAVADRQVMQWSVRIRDVLEEDPSAVARLRQLIDGILPSGQVPHVGHAISGGKVIQTQADRSEVYADGKVKKTIFTPIVSPFMRLGAIAAAHRVIAAVIAIVVVGGTVGAVAASGHQAKKDAAPAYTAMDGGVPRTNVLFDPSSSLVLGSTDVGAPFVRMTSKTTVPYDASSLPAACAGFNTLLLSMYLRGADPIAVEFTDFSQSANEMLGFIDEYVWTDSHASRDFAAGRPSTACLTAIQGQLIPLPVPDTFAVSTSGLFTYSGSYIVLIRYADEGVNIPASSLLPKLATAARARLP